MKDIAFVYKNNCHPVSQTYADAIGAESYRITGPIDGVWKGSMLPLYRYYFIESIMSMLVPVTKRLLGKKIIIIFRGNDGLFGEKTGAYLWTKNPIKKVFLLFLIKQMDGIIVESEMTKKDAQQWTNAPIEICESYVENKKYLEDITPNLHTLIFLFIGEYRPPYDHKNIEMLIDIFNDLPEYKLIIIGKNTEKLKEKAKENIDIKGFVENKEEYYKKATYYIHVPKYETGPITLLEAMTAGLLPITNTSAGHHILVKEVAQELIFDSTMSLEEIKRKIRELTTMPIQKRRKLSETFKKIGKNHFGKEEMGQKFKNTWKILIQRIEEKSLLSRAKR